MNSIQQTQLNIALSLLEFLLDADWRNVDVVNSQSKIWEDFKNKIIEKIKPFLDIKNDFYPLAVAVFNKIEIMDSGIERGVATYTSIMAARKQCIQKGIISPVLDTHDKVYSTSDEVFYCNYSMFVIHFPVGADQDPYDDRGDIQNRALGRILKIIERRLDGNEYVTLHYLELYMRTSLYKKHVSHTLRYFEKFENRFLVYNPGIEELMYLNMMRFYRLNNLSFSKFHLDLYTLVKGGIYLKEHFNEFLLAYIKNDDNIDHILRDELLLNNTNFIKILKFIVDQDSTTTVMVLMILEFMNVKLLQHDAPIELRDDKNGLFSLLDALTLYCKTGMANQVLDSNPDTYMF